MNHSGQSQKSYGEIKGKLEWQVRGKLHSLRLSIGKKATGEQFMVLRFLSSFNPDLRLDRLGFYQDHISKVAEMTSMDNGIIFVTGSTGEGKSTTMGVILNELATEQKKMVFTIEDPVEVNNPHLIQYQVQEEGEDKYHMGFSTYSKLLKRQNPDIVLLGEVRDKEEIEECIKMSKAGQLVFTTLHSSSTIQTMGRLKDEGITNGDLIDSLRGIISQKLYPKLCKCKIRLLETDPEYISGYDFIQYKRNRIGCQICRDKNKGFDGKVLIYEIRIFEGLDNDRLKTNIYVLPSLDVAERKFEEGLIEGPILNKIKKSTITGENNESK
jgi:type II secretory ATPase GspE/PulE/Tfp pilus assembly ATPase PilB-like protein